MEFTIKNIIKIQCKPPHPQPLSPKRGEGSEIKRCSAQRTLTMRVFLNHDDNFTNCKSLPVSVW